jgi:selenocysteine lyase/cysteine desulfurase
LANYTRKQLAKIPNLRLLDKGPQLCSLITFNIPGLTAEQIKSELFKRKINAVTSYRNFAVIDFDEKGVEWAIRVSPHYYNLETEIDLFVFELIQIIQLHGSSISIPANRSQIAN